MSSRLPAIAFLGLLTGLVIGIGDGIGRPLPALVGGAGLIGLLTLGLTLFGAAAAPAAWTERLHAGLRPGDDVELHDRCRVIALMWMVAVGGPALLFALRAGFPIVLGRIQSPLFASVAAGLFALVGSAVALGVSVALGAAVARGLERIVRRRPALTRLTAPGRNGLGAGLAAVALLSLGGLWGALPFFFGAAVLFWRLSAPPAGRGAALVAAGLTCGALVFGIGRLADAGPIARLGARLLGLT